MKSKGLPSIIFSAVAAIFILVSFTIILYNFSLTSSPLNEPTAKPELQVDKPPEPLRVQSSDDHIGNHGYDPTPPPPSPPPPPPPVPSPAIRVRKNTTASAKRRLLKPEVLNLFNSTDLSRRFDSRVEEFFTTNKCKVQFFMTWIGPVEKFGERELFGLGSLFQTNPKSCLVIVSNTMDSTEGSVVLQPFIDRGFRVRAVTPDLSELLKNTPGESWFNGIKNGDRDPGSIPLGQNLSNLVRLAVLYRHGGVYLDTDFIVLKDFSSLRNSLGAQSSDAKGHWAKLNNAALVFDKNHPLLYKFMEEFASTFNGNVWGHNGPHMVSRVVSKLSKFKNLNLNFTVLPTSTFYPVDWVRIATFFPGPKDAENEKWIRSTVKSLERSTYALHLWNSQSRKLKVEEGSVIWKLISQHCVMCV